MEKLSITTRKKLLFTEPKKESIEMKLKITSMSGKEMDMDLPTKENVYYFIDMYKKSLKTNQRVKVTCDLLGIDGYLQGTAPIR